MLGGGTCARHTTYGGKFAIMGRRCQFTLQMEKAAEACGARVRWLSDGWVALLSKDGHSKYVIGYSFPLNDAAAAQIANDKTATCAVLSGRQIPAIEHRVVRVSDLPAELHSAEVLATLALPLVVKPNEGKSGVHVLRARDEVELCEVTRFLTSHYGAIAFSPYVEIAHEYRVVVLGNDVRIIFEKHRNADWRHNLDAGATAKLVGDAEVRAALSVLALGATAALSLRFAAVDIVDAADQLAVLEINSSVTLERFSMQNPRHARLTQNVYKDAVAACFVRDLSATPPS